MHENREISSLPSLVNEGRFAKAINHNADMHVLEKADNVIVPVNRRTREGNPLRRLGRKGMGREEHLWSYTLPTQRGNQHVPDSRRVCGMKLCRWHSR